MIKAICAKCKRNLLASEFNRSSRTLNGLRSRCRKCQAEDKRIYLDKVKGHRKSKPIKIVTTSNMREYAEEVTREPILTSKERLLKSRLKYIRKVGREINDKKKRYLYGLTKCYNSLSNILIKL